MIFKTKEDYGHLNKRIIPKLCKTKEEYSFYLRFLSAYNLVKKYLNKEKTCLDIGCGDGYGCDFISYHAKKVVGIDKDSKIIERAKKIHKKDNLKFKVKNIESSNFYKNSFDVVVSFQVIGYVRNPKKYLSTLYKLTKSKGILVLSTINEESKHRKNKYRKNEYNYREFKDLLNKSFKKFEFYGVYANRGIIKSEKNKQDCLKTNNLTNFYRIFHKFLNKKDFKKYTINDFRIKKTHRKTDKALDFICVVHK